MWITGTGSGIIWTVPGRFARFMSVGNPYIPRDYVSLTTTVSIIQIGRIVTLKVKLYCVEEGCNREVHNLARQLCRKCYQRLHKRGTLSPLGICKHNTCKRKESYSGYCIDHRHIYYPEMFNQTFRFSKYLDENRVRILCSGKGCKNSAVCNGMCAGCDIQTKKIEAGFISSLRDYNLPGGGRVKCEASSEDCLSDAVANGLCRKHLQRVAKYGNDEEVTDTDLCPVSECGRVKRIRSTICKRCNQFRWRYTLTPEEVIRLFKPGNRVCSNPGCRDTERLHMDHDHACCPPKKYGTSSLKACGKCNRGWLCHTCNTSLGMLQENPERIRGLLVHIGAN